MRSMRVKRHIARPDRCSYGCQGVIEFFPSRAVATLDIPADAVGSMTRPARQRAAVRSTRQKSSVPTTMATRWTRRQTEVPFRVGASSWAKAGQGRATWEGKLLLGNKSSAACAGFWHTAAARQIVLRATPGAPADSGAMTAAVAALGPGQVAVELAGDVAL
jgi:hypothetical protein